MGARIPGDPSAGRAILQGKGGQSGVPLRVAPSCVLAQLRGEAARQGRRQGPHLACAGFSLGVSASVCVVAPAGCDLSELGAESAGPCPSLRTVTWTCTHR